MAATANKRYILGGVLVTAGILMILENLRILDNIIPGYLFDWYSIFILVGVVLMATREKITLGLIFTIIGGAFLLDEMAYEYNWYFDFWDIFEFWPVVFIIVGLSLILRRGRLGDSEKKSEFGDSSDYVDETAIFGGADSVITSQDFKGGKVTSIFGGSDINLVNATLAPGTNVLDVFVLFGGTDIIVPSDMNVRVEVTAIFGGFSDERKIVSNNPDNDGRELVIKGLVLFGGGEVK